MKLTSHLRILFLGVSGLIITSSALAQVANLEPDKPVLSQAQRQAQHQAILNYWTPERMATAQPMPIPGVPALSTVLPTTQDIDGGGDPGIVNGHPPGGGLYEPKVITFPPEVDSQSSGAQSSGTSQAFGTPPSTPDDLANYGPFQRFTMAGKYVIFPRSVHGKLFFTLNGNSFVCSGTVIGRGTVATAGHCNSDGNGTFATNRMFCPSWFQQGKNPKVGCWTAANSKTSSNWHTNGDPDYDYACLVMNDTGDTINNEIGNVTGWAGRAWNWNTDRPTMTFGYPQQGDFTGNTIQQTASVEWYDIHFGSSGTDNPASKFIGSDLTGGSSGGGWFLSWVAPGAEIADTDGSSITDPISKDPTFEFPGPFINGVNSHKRCNISCQFPPVGSDGVFWQEMSSPKFRMSNTDTDDSEDIFGVCFNLE